MYHGWGTQQCAVDEPPEVVAAQQGENLGAPHEVIVSREFHRQRVSEVNRGGRCSDVGAVVDGAPQQQQEVQSARTPQVQQAARVRQAAPQRA